MAPQKGVVCPVRHMRPSDKSSPVSLEGDCKKYLTRHSSRRKNCFKSGKNASCSEGKLQEACDGTAAALLRLIDLGEVYSSSHLGTSRAQSKLRR